MKNRLLRQKLFVMFSISLLLFCSTGFAAENIDPDDDGSQYAWGENVGWINLEPGGDGGPGAEVGESALIGYIWGENIGWIKFDLDKPVRACKVAADDLANFADQWLVSGASVADLRPDRQVDFADYGVLAAYWLDYCPDYWPLK